jgi:hypothetical protein
MKVIAVAVTAAILLALTSCNASHTRPSGPVSTAVGVSDLTRLLEPERGPIVAPFPGSVTVAVRFNVSMIENSGFSWAPLIQQVSAGNCLYASLTPGTAGGGQEEIHLRVVPIQVRSLRQTIAAHIVGAIVATSTNPAAFASRPSGAPFADQSTSCP